jgi:hypothetical protein
VAQVIVESNGAVMVQSLTMEQFHNRLVKHFNIAFDAEKLFGHLELVLRHPLATRK